MNRIARPAIAGLMLAAGLAACRKNDAAVDTMAANMDTTAAAAAVTTTPPPSKWTSPNTVGFAWVANTGEIALGKLGQTKAGNADVKKFAALMVTDHTQMREALDALAKRATIAMDTTMDDVRDLEGMASSDVKDLTEKPKGADWDKDFMDKQISAHQKVLDKLQDAAKNTTDPDLTKALTDAAGKVQEHLTQAQTIRANLK
jgi:putative membrane protein